MKISPAEREYLERTRVGRLATADSDGRPHVVPICFVLIDNQIASPLDEKPKSVEPSRLRRVQNIKDNDRVALICDHWAEEWDKLGWVQVRGSAEVVSPAVSDHGAAVRRLRDKYSQYADHALEERELIWITIRRVISWGTLQP